jgi:drug/metabolite transporter (DMT)-like permease
MIKLGYGAFEIDPKSIPDIIMFAAVRFVVCGVIICALALILRGKIASPGWKSVLLILLSGLFSIVLHYAFTYIGLSDGDSSKTALLKQLGALLYICFSFLFFKSEKFSIFKILGAAVGFLGIFAINFDGGAIVFTRGDILIILASVCTVVSSCISKACVKGSSPFWVTGISQLSGGIILLIAALIMGAGFPKFNLYSTAIFIYICASSIIAYVTFSYLQKTLTNSHLFIIKFAEPLFACIFGAMWLGENILKPQYLLAFLLISGGITLGNFGAVKRKNKIKNIAEKKI